MIWAPHGHPQFNRVGPNMFVHVVVGLRVCPKAQQGQSTVLNALGQEAGNPWRFNSQTLRKTLTSLQMAPYRGAYREIGGRGSGEPHLKTSANPPPPR